MINESGKWVTVILRALKSLFQGTSQNLLLHEMHLDFLLITAHGKWLLAPQAAPSQVLCISQPCACSPHSPVPLPFPFRLINISPMSSRKYVVRLVQHGASFGCGGSLKLKSQDWSGKCAYRQWNRKMISSPRPVPPPLLGGEGERKGQAVLCATGIPLQSRRGWARLWLLFLYFIFHLK